MHLPQLSDIRVIILAGNSPAMAISTMAAEQVEGEDSTGPF